MNVTAPNSGRELVNYSVTTPSIAEEFITKASNGQLQHSPLLVSDFSLESEDLGKGLVVACKNGHLADAAIILEAAEDEIIPGDLGAALVALMEPENPADLQKRQETVELLAKSTRFPEIPCTFVKEAFQKAVLANAPSLVSFIVMHAQLATHLTLQDLFHAMWVCVDKDFGDVLTSLLQSHLSPSIPNENKEKLKSLFSLALEKRRYEMLGKFAKIPSYREVLQECLGKMLMHLVKFRPIGAITKFLSCDWAGPISDNDLVAAATESVDDASSPKFRTLIANPRYDQVYENGLISSKLSEEKAKTLLHQIQEIRSDELFVKRMLGVACITLLSCDAFPVPPALFSRVDIRDWYLGFCSATVNGISAHVVRILLVRPQILSEMSNPQKETLFLSSCETSARHSDNFAIAKTMLITDKVATELSQPTIDRSIVLSGQLGLHEVILMLAKYAPKFKTADSQILKQSFIAAAKRGHLEAVKVILATDRSEEITSTEIRPVFDHYCDNADDLNLKSVVVYLLTDPLCRKISAEDSDPIFERLYPLLCEDVVQMFIISWCFRNVSDESLEEIFAPLTALGKVRDANVQHEVTVAVFFETLPEIWKKKRILEHIVQTARFAKYCKANKAELSAIYLTAAGLGIPSIVKTIQSRAEIPLPINFASYQGCSNVFFFAFYSKVPAGVIVLPIPIPEEYRSKEKLAVFQTILNARQNNEYTFLKSWLMLASQFGSREAVELFLRYIPKATFQDADMKEALDLAHKSANKEVSQLLSDQGCVIS